MTFARLSFAVLAALILTALMVFAARFGFSRLLVKYALVTKSMAAANEAISLTPSDADAHRVRAAILTHEGLFAEAAKELEVAASLRPRDDYLWLELGLARDETEDTQGALAAFNEAVKCAPYYAHTRWQRGNLLLRLGRYDEAFADIRAAARGNRTFFPSLLDLAWTLSRKDPTVTEEWIQITDDRARMAFAQFLARKGKGSDAVAQYKRLDRPPSEANKQEFVRSLMEAKALREAYEIWSGTAGGQSPTIYDGGFEGSLTYDAVGFGWYIPRELSKVSLALDVKERQTGSQSLQVTFDGNSVPGAPLISQTILVQPSQRYRINFAVSTRNIVTGGLPLLTAADAATGQLLGKSENFPQASAAWKNTSFEITTLPSTQAIILTLTRNNCGSSPCPAFGTLWLDSFSIQTSPN